MSIVEIEPLLRPYNPIYDIRYATTNNRTGKILYDDPTPRLDERAAEALAYAAELFMAEGLRLVIWDTLRTDEAHQQLLDLVRDERYVATESKHLTGLAVDLSLANANGQELDMGTDYDDFSRLAHIDTTEISADQHYNRLLLSSKLIKAQFTRWPYEWWHFDYKGGRVY